MPSSDLYRESLDPAARQHASEMRAILLQIEDGSPETALRHLDERGAAEELVRQQYTGRYPFELLQNADDAARESGIRGRTRFLLTDSALLVADNGFGFGDTQVDAICSLGRSSKGPSNSIGHKGLGFKSVGEITDRPQIVSQRTQFQFDAKRVHDELTAAFGVLPSRQRIPVYAFPYPVEPADLAADAEQISSLRHEGFNTVIRLPFADGLDRNLVSEILSANLNPRLLLFLPSIDHLELRGTEDDFSAEVVRELADGVERVLMETDAGPEEWLVYRGSTVPTAEALAPLGEEWLKMDEAKFAVAVPLATDDEHTHPRTDETFPLHVYFPTEERPGLRVAVHAEWVLTMDRRRISFTPEASKLNEELLEAVTDFVASAVAIDLVDRCGLSLESVRALVPEDAGNLDGAAKAVADLWHGALAEVPFLPLADSEQLGTPSEVKLLPATLPNYSQAHRLFTLPADRTLRADIEADSDVRDFVSNVGDGGEMTDAEILAMLRVLDAAAAPELYSFLLAWRKRTWTLVDNLRSAPCVLTVNGEFLSPAEHSIFLPRRDASVPDDIPVPIAALIDIEGLEQLLRDLGVKSFEWRELIRDYLIKILEEADADPDERAKAMRGLRAYQASRRDPSEVGPAYLGRVLLPARNADGSSTAMRRAGQIYFGREWTSSSDLEEIYAAFGQIEFLAADVPSDPAEREGDDEFYRMLGVSDHPRVIQAGGAQLLLHGANNPHRKASLPLYNEWLHAVGAQRCPMDHDSSFQRLSANFHVDRLEEVFSAEDPRRNLLLWHQLARHWGKVYEDALTANIRCEHRYHSLSRARSVDSLLAYTLRSRAWVPVVVGNSAHVARPEEAWFETSAPPARIRSRIPLISEGMHHVRGGPAMIEELGLIDTSRPRVDDLLGLLESVAAEADEAGSTSQAVEAAARWIQRSIDDALSTESEPHTRPEDVRVLASHANTAMFVSQPLYAEDALLRDTWQRIAPMLLADTDSGRLKKFLSLTKLDDEIEAIAVPLNIRRDETLYRIVRRIDDAKPYIVALIGYENSRMQSPAVRALRHLEVVVCEKLIIRYQYDGSVVERDDASCFIAVHKDRRDGRRTQSTGTAYIELDPGVAEPNWFAVGNQLAQHLGVGTHTDAVTMLLKVEAEDRARMMASRHISAETVGKARVSLDLHMDDERPFESILDAYMTPQDDDDARAAEPKWGSEGLETGAPTSLRGSNQSQSASPPAAPTTPVATPAQPPVIDVASITITDANPTTVGSTLPSAQRRTPSLTFGASSSAPSVQSEAEKRRVGKLGEKIAFLKERERIERMGSNPDLVVWQSKDDELASVDILSVDDDGDVMYIEVKSTMGSNPGDPFYISEAELLAASVHGSRYYIYRVTDVDTETPRITRWHNPIDVISNGQGRLLLSTAQMQLSVE